MFILSFHFSKIGSSYPFLSIIFLWKFLINSFIAFFFFFTFLVTQRVKCLPAIQETWVRSLGQEDPLEKELATHSSTLAWRIPWMEDPVRLQAMLSQSWT